MINDNNLLPIKCYFDNNDLVNKDLDTGFGLNYLAPALPYMIKGESISTKSFIISFFDDIYLLNSKGILDQVLKLDINNFYELQKSFKWEFTNIKQISAELFCGYIEHLDSLSQFDRYFVLLQADYNLSKVKIIKYYSLIDVPYKLDFHSYIYKNINHIYLVGISASPGQMVEFIIQEQKNNRVIWEWKSSDWKYFNLSTIRTGDFGIHINFIQELGPDKLIVSCRTFGLICIDKRTNLILWTSSQNKNDFNSNPPILQHDIEPINYQKQQFAVFSNNWPVDSPKIQLLISKKYVPSNLILSRDFSSLNIYDVLNMTATKYTLPKLATPRCGNINYINNNIFDINYGHVLEKINNTVYYLGGLDEIDIKSSEVLFSLKIKNPQYRIHRGI